MALQLIPKRRMLPNPTLIHLFSTSSDSNDRNNEFKPSSDRNNEIKPSSTSDSSLSSYFSDVKASLRRPYKFPPPPRSPTRPSSPTHSSPPPKVASLKEIGKNLVEFRRQSEGRSGPAPSFQELYKRNVQNNVQNSNPEDSGGGNLPFNAIRESLRRMRPSDTARNDGGSKDPLSLSAFKNSLRLRPTNSPSPQRTTAMGGTDALPVSVFGKEMKERRDGEESSAMKTEFVTLYDYKEMGERLKKLRPEGKGEGWFSIEELNQRLMKLREIEQKEVESRKFGLPHGALRECLVKLSSSDEEKAGKASSK